MKKKTRKIDFSETIIGTRNGKTFCAYNNADEVISMTAPDSASSESRQVIGYKVRWSFV